MKNITNENLKKKIILATCSSIGKPGLNELLKRPELSQVLKQDRISKETKIIEKLLSEISKNGPVAYGFDETKDAIKIGAVKSLLVTDGLIHQYRQNEKFHELDKLMKQADTSKAEIYIISSDHNSGKKLDGLGGIAAFLRYKLKF